MAESTSSYTFYDLLVKVAKASSLAYFGSNGSSKTMPPINKHDLELCKDVINSAMTMFIADAPATGWRWIRRILSLTLTATRVTGTADAADATSLTDATLEGTYDTDDDLNGWYIYILSGTGIGSQALITDYTASGGVITVAAWLDEHGNSGGTSPALNSTFAITPVETVGGDIARYPLPENFSGEIDGNIEYENDNNACGITWVDESTIRSRRTPSVVSGYPMLAAIRQLEPSSSALGPKRRMEIIFDPEPSGAYTFNFPYTLAFNKFDAEMGLSDSASGTTLVDAERTEPDDYFNGWKITVKDGTGVGSYAIVTDYTGSTGTFTVTDWLKADGSAAGTDPSSNSTYYVEPATNMIPCGARFDDAVMAACMFKAALEWPNDVPANAVEQYTQKALPQARLIDARSAPRTLGADARIGLIPRTRTWNRVTTEHDI